jgi:hypothetical protein
VLPWALRTMQADLAAARQIDPTVKPPRALSVYQLQPDSGFKAGASAESIAQATVDMINQVNAWHTGRPGAASGAPVALPREVAVLALDLANVGRDVASALQSHVRVDVTRSDGTVEQVWIGPDGHAYPFDPERARPNGDGAVWVHDPTTSRSRYFSSAVAERNGLLTPEQRAEADAYRLTYRDLGRLYVTAPARQETFEQAFNAETDTRGARLGATDPALPGLLHHAFEAHEFWQREAQWRGHQWNAEDPLGSDLALSEWARQARSNEESAEEMLRLLQATARGGPDSPPWTEQDVRSATDRLDAMTQHEQIVQTTGSVAPTPGVSDLLPDAGDERLGAVDPALPGLLHRAVDAHEFWRREVERRRGQWNAEGPLGGDLALSESIREAQWNEESADEVRRLLQDVARGAPGGRTLTTGDVPAITERLDRLATAERAAANQAGPSSPATASDGPDAPPAASPAAPQAEPRVLTLTEMGLRLVNVPATGDGVIHALVAVADVEVSAVGPGRPATPEELRTHFAGALTADLSRAPGERRLWPLVDGWISGTPSPTDDQRRAVISALTAPDGSERMDELTLAAAGAVLGLRIVLLPPDGVSIEFGPSTGRRVVVVRLPEAGPYTGQWAATEPVDAVGPPVRVPGRWGPAASTATVAPPVSAQPEPSGGPGVAGDSQPVANLDLDPFGGR